MSDGVSSIGSFLSFSATLPADELPATYAALTWTDWDEPTSLGEIGEDTEVLKYNPVKTGVVEKRLGASDSGTQSIEAPFVSADAGQAILRTAATNKTAIAVRETLAEGTIYYYQAYVPTFKTQTGGSGDIQMLSTTLEITGSIVEG